LSGPLFLYGTLLDAAVFRAKAGGLAPFRRALPGWLAGHRRVTLRGTPYPTLRPGPGEVAGLWLRVPPAMLARLARYEGPSYALRPVRVATPRGARHARAWFAPGWRCSATPWQPPPRRLRARAGGVRA
jgi:gamma-glutamylcyclotransferase (GGCT)/AIG2-like uncharacterized protein YtfP